MNGDAVLEDLHKVADQRVRPADEADAIAGAPARYVASPESTGEAAEVLRVAAQHGMAVVARGSGTKQDWGLPPESVDLVLETGAMTGVREHAAGDLVAVVRAGTRMSDLQAALAEAGQQLALDAPLPEATLGGTVATNTSGPRRILYGTMRDLLIGVTFVRADGVVAKAGGKVVKNVAGYDFGKLLTGSFGTLGLVTEVALRLHPLPMTQRFVTVEVLEADVAAEAALGVLRSQVAPSAVELELPADGPLTLTVLVEGVEAGAEQRAADVQHLLGPGSAVDSAPDWFGCYPFRVGELGLKVTCTLTGVGPVLAVARGIGQRHGVPLTVRGSASGVLYGALPADVDTTVASQVLEELRAVAWEYDGSVVVLTAPAGIRDALDVWGPVAGIDLMRGLKDQLDADHRLAPGRFVGGI
jgi:glycolate dehydrogenase FAD-binding subunit